MEPDKDDIMTVYKCYLGKELLYRTAVIHDYVTLNNGKWFFEKFSTDKDTILVFIKKCEALDLL